MAAEIYYVSRDDTMMTTGRPHCSFTRRVGAPEQLFKLRRTGLASGRVASMAVSCCSSPRCAQVEHPIAVWTAAIASTQR